MGGVDESRANGQIQITAKEPVFQVVRNIVMHDNLNIGIGPFVFCHHRGQENVGAGPSDTQIDLAAEVNILLAKLVAEVIIQKLNLPQSRRQQLTGGCKGKPGPAVEEKGIVSLLQPPDMVAHALLRYECLLGRFRDI
ncbi:hypothetical protein SDC9_184794 [bioreactor metagenome]|uniref:Uncharacterized protein n=1 Tax=bioreactor metagenome TaxID=1076179 RepID=A0A645HE15_9ZZZZ